MSEFYGGVIGSFRNRRNCKTKKIKTIDEIVNQTNRYKKLYETIKERDEADIKTLLKEGHTLKDIEGLKRRCLIYEYKYGYYEAI